MSTELYCSICKTTFTKPYYMKKHLQSKKHESMVNDSTKKYICTCGKTYLHRQSLQKHKITCQVKEEPVTENIIVQQLKEERVEREKERKELKEQIEQLLEKVGTTHNTTNHIDTQNNLTININAFGNENLDYLTDQVIIQCIGKVYGAIPTIIEKIHFNPEHPENHNIKITNKKMPHASIMCTDNKWKMVDREYAISTLVNNGYHLLDEKFNEDPSRFTEEKRKHYRRFQENYDNDEKDTMRRIKNDVELVILNGTKEVGNQKLT